MLNIFLNQKSFKIWIKIILILFITADIGYSFYQYFHTPLGGELAQVISLNPNQGDYQVLQNPFGLGEEKYTGINRFFSHWMTSTYFKRAPLFLQKFVSPINSIYLSAAIAKTLIQIVLILIISTLISNKKIFTLNFLLVSAIITPLFQTFGFNRYMGVIDQSILYTFFYALPLSLLLLFYLPFFINYFHHPKTVKISSIQQFVLLLLCPVLALSGPLLPGVILIVSLLTTINYIKKTFEDKPLPLCKAFHHFWRVTPKSIILLFGIASLFSLYSLYIGQKNIINISNSLSIVEKYKRIPSGIFFLFTTKIGLSLLLFSIIINLFLLKKYCNEHSKKIILLVQWLTAFSILYILLLPLGGYRSYRPNIVRYDTFMPITIILFFLFGYSSLLLIKNANLKIKKLFIPFLIIILLIFTNADKTKKKHYNCERNALVQLSKSTSSPVILTNDCTVLEWQIIVDPSLSKINADLFEYWNITNSSRLYYQQ